MSQSRFDQQAASWDEHPDRSAMAKAIALAIIAQVPVNSAMTVLDYGCGTGLVSMVLQPQVKHVIGVDSSQGMLAKLQEKVAAQGVSNVETLLLDLENSQLPPNLSVDLIISSMALHHIKDITALLHALTKMLMPGGYIALADLDSEDGSFHADHTGVHHSGIERKWLIEQLQELGFHKISATTAHVMERAEAQFPIFLISGQLG